MEPFSATAMTFGVCLLVISWIYLIIIAFKADFNWGLVTVFLPVLSYIYAFFDFKKTQGVLLFAGLGWLLILFSL